jgi:hypothetical protein
MNIVTVARVVAIALGIITFAFFFIHDNFRLDNLFFVPDMILVALLIVAGLLPQKLAVPALVFVYGMATGIFMTSVSSYAVRGEFGLASFIGVIGSAIMAVLLVKYLLGKKNGKQ